MGSNVSTDVDKFDNTCAMESIVDEILLQAGNAFELHEQQQKIATNNSTLVYGRIQFAVPKTDEEVVEARRSRASVPKKTQTDTKYCICLWNEQTTHRNIAASTECPR